MTEGAVMKQRQTVIYSVLGILFIFVSLVTNVTFPVVILALILAYKIVHLPRAVDFLIIRACFGFVLLLATFNIVGLLLRLINVEVNANVFSIVALLVMGVIFFVQTATGRIRKPVSISRFDIVTTIPVLIGTVFLLLYIFCNGLSFSENLVRFMGSSSDQSAHLSMFNDILRNNGNHVYSTDKLSINTPGINSYPMGWHQAMAVAGAGLFGVHATATPFITVVAIYFFCALLTFMLFVVAISAFTSLIYEKIFSKDRIRKLFDKKPSILSETFIKSSVVLTVVFLFLYVAFCELGYINFIYAVAIAILGGILLIGIPKPSNVSSGIISIFALLLFVAVEAWYIMAIPLGIVLLYLTVAYIKTYGKALVRRRSTSLIAMSYILLGVASVVILRNVLADGSSEQIQIGNAAAPWLPVALVLLSVIGLAVVLSNRQKEDLLHVLMNGFFITILLLTAMNFLHLQEYSYYQQKMLYALFALSVPISFLFVIRYLQANKIQPPLAIAMVLFSIYILNPSGIINMTKNIIRPTSDSEVKIIDDYFQSGFNDKSEVVFIKDYRKSEERYTESYARLLLSKIVSPGDCYNQLIMPLLSLTEEDELNGANNTKANEAARRCYGNVSFFVLTDNGPVYRESLKKT